jgi:hypothetical protein
MNLFSRLLKKDPNDPDSAGAPDEEGIFSTGALPAQNGSEGSSHGSPRRTVTGEVQINEPLEETDAAQPSASVAGPGDRTDRIDLPPVAVPAPRESPRTPPDQSPPRGTPVGMASLRARLYPPPALPPPLPPISPATRAAPPPAATRRDRGSRPATNTASDLAALHSTFEDLTIDHVRPVRTLMLELRWGDAPASWIDLARPSVRSLRAMAAQVELPSLCQALDEFSAALDRAAQAQGATLAGPTRQTLLAAYNPLIQALPRAFALDGESDRREPVIVQALLRQVPGLDPIMIDRLCAAGLGRLEALLSAGSQEIAAVAAVPREVAAQVTAAVDDFRSSAGLDANGGTEGLRALVTALEETNRAYDEAASGWSPNNQSAKRRLRQQRTQLWLRITVVMARAGELEWLAKIEPLPFARKLEELGRFLRQARPPLASISNADTPPAT